MAQFMRISIVLVVAFLFQPVTSKSLRNLKGKSGAYVRGGGKGGSGGEAGGRVTGDCNSNADDCTNRVGGTTTADATSRAIQCSPAGEGVGLDLDDRNFWKNLEMDEHGFYIVPEGVDLCSDDCDCASACCWTNGGFGIQVVEDVVSPVRFCGNIGGLSEPAALNGCVHPRGIPPSVIGGL